MRLSPPQLTPGPWHPALALLGDTGPFSPTHSFFSGSVRTWHVYLGPSPGSFLLLLIGRTLCAIPSAERAFLCQIFSRVLENLNSTLPLLVCSPWMAPSQAPTSFSVNSTESQDKEPAYFSRLMLLGTLVLWNHL